MTADRRPRVRWRGSAAAAALATVVLVTFVAFVPRYAQRAVQVFVIVIGALVVRLLVRAVVASVSRPGPLAFDQALVRPPEQEVARASEPDRIRFEVGSATHRAMELHQQVRRRLRALAADRLEAAHGVDLDRDPDQAERLLSAEAWDLLRPNREAPEDRFGPGLPIDAIDRIVTSVEGLSP